MKEATRGVLLMAASAVFFSVGGVFIKVIPWSPLAINGVRCLLGAAVLALYMIAKGRRFCVNFPTVLGALGIFGTTVFYNAATKFTTAGNAIALEYTSPLFIIVFSYLFFCKKPRRADIIACGAVFLGILWFFLDSLSTGNLLGDGLGICSALCVSVVYLLKLRPRTDIAAMIFWGLLLGAVTCLPFLPAETVFSPPVLLCAAALGIFQLGVAYVLFFEGLSRCDPVPAVLAGSLEPILNPIWVALFYGELISPLAFPGVVIVLVTVLVYNLFLAARGQ